jgi:hypothetical protein
MEQKNQREVMATNQRMQKKELMGKHAEELAALNEQHRVEFNQLQNYLSTSRNIRKLTVAQYKLDSKRKLDEIVIDDDDEDLLKLDNEAAQSEQKKIKTENEFSLSFCYAAGSTPQASNTVCVREPFRDITNTMRVQPNVTQYASQAMTSTDAKRIAAVAPRPRFLPITKNTINAMQYRSGGAILTTDVTNATLNDQPYARDENTYSTQLPAVHPLAIIVESNPVAMSTHVTYGCGATLDEPIVVAARKSGLNRKVSPLHAQIEYDPVAAVSTHVTYGCGATLDEPIVVAARKSCLKKTPLHVQFDLVAEEEINNHHTQSQMPVQSILDEQTEHAATQQSTKPLEEDEANESTSSENESTSDCSDDSTDASDENDNDVAAFDEEEETAIAQRAADDEPNDATQSGPFNSAQLNEIYSNLDSFNS